MVREVLCFVIGAAAGFGAATYLMKSKYEAMVEEETKSAMEWVKNKENDKKEEITHGEEVKDIEKITSNYNTISKKVEESGVLEINEPYRIAEGDYLMDDDEYGKVSLDFYTDDNSLYEDGEPISNVDDVVGEDNINFLKNIEDDVIYIRNDKYKIDYEICKIVGSYIEGNGYV